MRNELELEAVAAEYEYRGARADYRATYFAERGQRRPVYDRDAEQSAWNYLRSAFVVAEADRLHYV